MSTRRSTRRSTLDSSTATNSLYSDKKKIKSVLRSRKLSITKPKSPPVIQKKLKKSSDILIPKNLQGENTDQKTPIKNRGRPSLKRRSSILQPSNTDRTIETKPSPMKTRRVQKSRDAVPRCTLCFKTKGELKSCSKCNLNYHLQKCLLYSKTMETCAEKLKSWLCPKCIRCDVCMQLIDDVNNRECIVCFHAWHGTCSIGKGLGAAESWTCNRCCKTNGPPEHTTPVKAANLSDLPAWSPFGSPSKAIFLTPKRGRGRPKGSTKVVASENSKESDNEADEATMSILAARDAVWDELLEHHKQVEANSSLSPRKGKKKIIIKKAAPPKLTTSEDLDLFQIAKARYLAEQTIPSPIHRSKETTVGKWVYIGGTQKMKALYDSPYPDDVRNSEKIYICPYCLHPTGDFHVHRIHRDNCPFHHPPGNEIYRDEELSFYEVDGADQKNYCRNLCLLSKMFISSKTLHHEVDTFSFYILTEITLEGCRIVGYFSKEKNPSKNNNLSCLLTLPSESRKGYGRLLIDMSYQLSALELKVGSPEHPLSDLGLFAYRGYWRSSILCYLRSVRTLPHTSIKTMSLTTRIHPTDIVNQLLRDKLLIYKDGNYFVKTGKRAYKWPLSVCRRRVVRSDKLFWKPSKDTSQLDPTKLNYYV